MLTFIGLDSVTNMPESIKVEDANENAIMIASKAACHAIYAFQCANEAIVQARAVEKAVAAATAAATTAITLVEKITVNLVITPDVPNVIAGMLKVDSRLGPGIKEEFQKIVIKIHDPCFALCEGRKEHHLIQLYVFSYEDGSCNICYLEDELPCKNSCRFKYTVLHDIFEGEDGFTKRLTTTNPLKFLRRRLEMFKEGSSYSFVEWGSISMTIDSFPCTIEGDPIIPDDLCCPITHQLMRQPVLLEDGYMYEEDAIRQWLNRNPTSPMTREDISMHNGEFQWERVRNMDVLCTHAASIIQHMTVSENDSSRIHKLIQRKIEFHCDGNIDNLLRLNEAVYDVLFFRSKKIMKRNQRNVHDLTSSVSNTLLSHVWEWCRERYSTMNDMVWENASDNIKGDRNRICASCFCSGDIVMFSGEACLCSQCSERLPSFKHMATKMDESFPTTTHTLNRIRRCQC